MVGVEVEVTLCGWSGGGGHTVWLEWRWMSHCVVGVEVEVILWLEWRWRSHCVVGVEVEVTVVGVEVEVRLCGWSGGGGHTVWLEWMWRSHCVVGVEVEVKFSIEETDTNI